MSASPSSAPRATLAHDQRGSVLLIALFALMVLAGFLFHVAGSGNAIDHRNRGQHAADAAAMSGAVVQARAMNDLVLVNMVKLGGTVTLTHDTAALEGALTGGVLALTMCVFDQTACSAAKDLFKKAKKLAQSLATSGPGLAAALASATEAQEALISLSPIYADARMEEVAREFPGVAGAFFAPALVLPVEPEDVGDWCDRATGGMPAMLAVSLLGTSLYHLVAIGVATGAAGATCEAVASPGVRLVEGAERGSDHFQVHAYTLMDPLSERDLDNLRKTALWGGGQDAMGGPIDTRRRAASQVKVAAGEYYFDGGELDDDLGDRALWEEKWKARVTRFRPVDDLTGFDETCAIRWASAGCDRLGTELRAALPFLAH